MKIDRYSFFARLLPALVAIMPLLAFLVFVLSSDHELPKQLKTLSFVVVSYALLAQFGRDLGKKIEPKLFDIFGGKPSVAILRHRDTRLDSITKARYHKFLSSSVPDLIIPTALEEQNAPDTADKIYDSAATWLRVRTSSDSLLLEENISYGMRRNLLGLKYVGIAFCVLVPTALATVKFFENTPFSTSDYILFSLSCVLLAIWCFVVKTAWVLVPAEAYAMRLLENCDKID